jgi:hypothetical protein
MFKRAGLKPVNNNNRYISGGVGAMNISNRRALYRRAAQSNCCTEKKTFMQNYELNPKMVLHFNN